MKDVRHLRDGSSAKRNPTPRFNGRGNIVTQELVQDRTTPAVNLFDCALHIDYW